MNDKTLMNALKLSHVPRWSIVDTFKTQYVSDHTYRVQVIALYLIEELQIRMHGDTLLKKILFHDIDEAETGDIPTTCKKRNPDFIGDTSVERAVIKLADTIEAHIWLTRYGVQPHNVEHPPLERIEQFVMHLTALLRSDQVGEVVNKIINIGITHA